MHVSHTYRRSTSSRITSCPYLAIEKVTFNAACPYLATEEVTINGACTYLAIEKVTLNAAIHGLHVQLMQVTSSAVLGQGPCHIPLQQGLVPCLHSILRAAGCSLASPQNQCRAER